MFGIGGFELFIILVFGFLIFGPEKLPEIARTVGKAIARFRQAQDEMNDVIKSTDIYDPNSDEPFKDPMQALDKLAKHQEEKAASASQKSAGSAKKATSQKAAEPSAKPSSQAAQPAKTSSGEGPGDAGDASAATDASGSTAAPRQESFTERKARYERERAARKAAQEKAAEGDSPDAPSADAGQAASTEAQDGDAKAEGGER